MDKFEHAISIARHLQTILERVVHVYMYKYSKQLVDALTNKKHTNKRRLMLIIVAVRKAYCQLKITKVELVLKRTICLTG